MTLPTASIIIIGNEILSGKVHDANSHYLAVELRALGVDVRRISVIPDEAEEIALEVSGASGEFDYVFVAGGVGPTHDDVTMEGIARGFGVGMVENARMLEALSARCGGKMNEALRKMALLPEGAEFFEAEGAFPPVAVRNVWIFPGIPEFLRRKFSAIRERFRSAPFILRKVYVNEEECFIAHCLESVIVRFPDVMVGSYPKVGIPEYKVMVTIEATDEGSLKGAYEMLIGLLPEGVVVRSE